MVCGCMLASRSIDRIRAVCTKAAKRNAASGIKYSQYFIVCYPPEWEPLRKEGNLTSMQVFHAQQRSLEMFHYSRFRMQQQHIKHRTQICINNGEISCSCDTHTDHRNPGSYNYIPAVV